MAVGDKPAYIAALAAERLGIPFHPAEAARCAGDKNLSSAKFSHAGMPVTQSYIIPVDLEPAGSMFYPCVLKPLGLSASRGVIRANNDGEFREAFRRIRAILHRPEILRLDESRNRLIQVERFIEGREFALEGIVTAGKLRTLAIFDKPDPLDGPYFEETIYVTPSRENAGLREALEAMAVRAVAALGLSHGPIHAEMRVNQEGIFVLEVAARPIGGLCARALRFEGGQPLEEIILRHAVGEAITCPQAEPAAVMMIPIPHVGVYQGAIGMREALAVPEIEDIVITAKVGQELLPLPEGASYLGFIFARGERAEASVREAHKRLSFKIAHVLSISSQ